MVRADFKEFQKSLGRRICDLRKQKGWSQEEFAYESGLGRASMGTIERGEANIRLSTMLGICQALGTTVCELLKGVGETPKRY
ncbi:MAG TPA: helix-turn-helix transcriptional regulator [Candidatus Angelobacter sp.]|jgi:transcriptional regulator with XRE-family HTH domain|nr:helix-turn-helix transcriptional regulator [Candidatus Angelobacter sp.]